MLVTIMLIGGGEKKIWKDRDPKETPFNTFRLENWLNKL